MAPWNGPNYRGAPASRTRHVAMTTEYSPRNARARRHLVVSRGCHAVRQQQRLFVR